MGTNTETTTNEANSEPHFTAAQVRRQVRRLCEEVVQRLHLQRLLPVEPRCQTCDLVERVVERVPDVLEWDPERFPRWVEALVRRDCLKVLVVTWLPEVVEALEDTSREVLKHRVCAVVQAEFMHLGSADKQHQLRALDPVRWGGITDLLQDEKDPAAPFLVAGYVNTFMRAQDRAIRGRHRTVRECCQEATEGT